MSIRRELTLRATHVLVVATGIFEDSEAKLTIREAIEAAAKHNLFKILIDCRQLNGEPGIVQRFDLADSISRYYHQSRIQSPGKPFIRLAVVGSEPLIDRDRFGEVVARNRGVPIKVTTSFDEALQWLELDDVD
jgi:hypothetical protein